MTERRVVPRVEPKQPLDANVMMNVPARILDISSRGAQIEVASSLPPSGPCDLRIRFAQGEFAVHATVRRCRVSVVGAGTVEQPGVFYRAGLEFDEIDPESLAWLASNVLFPAQA